MALSVFAYDKRHVKATKRKLIEKYGDTKEEDNWPTVSDGSKAKCVPILRNVIKDQEDFDYLEGSMWAQVKQNKKK